MTKQERDPPVLNVVDLMPSTPGLFPALKYFWSMVSFFVFFFFENSIELDGPRRVQSEVWDPATLRSPNINIFLWDSAFMYCKSWWVFPPGLYLDSGWLHSLPHSHSILSQYICWSLTRFLCWVILDKVDREHPFTRETEFVCVHVIICYIISRLV